MDLNAVLRDLRVVQDKLENRLSKLCSVMAATEEALDSTERKIFFVEDLLRGGSVKDSVETSSVAVDVVMELVREDFGDAFTTENFIDVLEGSPFFLDLDRESAQTILSELSNVSRDPDAPDNWVIVRDV